MTALLISEHLTKSCCGPPEESTCKGMPVTMKSNATRGQLQGGSYTLRKANMEPEKGPFKQNSILYRALVQIPCVLLRSVPCREAMSRIGLRGVGAASNTCRPTLHDHTGKKSAH